MASIASNLQFEGFLAQFTAENVCPAPAITLDKSADKTELVAGETITYTFTSTNTGNTPLIGVAITEGSFSGSGAMSPLTYSWPGVPGTLLADQTVTATSTYVVAQADVDAGVVRNTASVVGNPPTGPQ